jgi:hypothetical protein
MDRDEIFRYLHASLAHSITVDVMEVSEAPGNVRTITIHNDDRVTIEFQKSQEYVEGGDESGGLKYYAPYPELEEAIQDLEEYLGRPVEEWGNFTSQRYEPMVLEEPDPAANFRYFEDLVRRKLIKLPRLGKYELAGIHWRHIALYGEYRPDKLREEAEARLRRKRNLDEDDEESADNE